MSDENPNLLNEPSSDLNVKLPEVNIPEVVESFSASPLDQPINTAPPPPDTSIPPPPVIPNLPPPPPASSMPPPPPPSNAYATNSAYSNHPQYKSTYNQPQYQPQTQSQQTSTTGKSNNKILTGCCLGCVIVVVLMIAGIAIGMKSCGGNQLFGGIGSMVGDVIAMKSMSKSDIENKAEQGFTLDQLTTNPEQWQGKYVVFDTFADIVDSTNTDSQTITIKSPMAVIININPNLGLQSNTQVRVWGKISKFDMSAISKYAPDMPKDASVLGFIVACAVEPADGSNTPDDNENSTSNDDTSGGKPPVDGEQQPEQTPEDGTEEIPQK